MTFPRQRQQSKSVVQSQAMERALFACVCKKLDGQNTQKPYIPSFRDLISKWLMQWTVHTDPFPHTTLQQGLGYSRLKHRTEAKGQRVGLFI